MAAIYQISVEIFFFLSPNDKLKNGLITEVLRATVCTAVSQNKLLWISLKIFLQ